MRGKRGQFYLLAAIIIIAAIIGFAAYSNFARQKELVTTYDLGDELRIEAAEVLSFGVMRGDEVDDAKLVEHFTTLFDSHAGTGKEIYYIFGNSDGISAYSWGDLDTGEVDLKIGGKISFPITTRVRTDLPVIKEDGKIIITVTEEDGNTFTKEFDLKPGQNFYFVISEEVGEEDIVASG